MLNTKKLIAGAAVAAVLTVGAGGVAIAAQQGVMPGQENEPAVSGSVAAPTQTEANDATEGSGNDAAEAKQLESLAKIDQAAAERIALQAVPGEVQKTELDNENGFVAYSVEIMRQDGTLQEVVVDAGDGTILAQQAEDNDANEGPEAGAATR